MNVQKQTDKQPTVGSLFSGIGGCDLGFERAGFTTAWQVEIDPVNRAVLADRFPHAKQLEDVRECGKHNLTPVDVITGGFPCQDLSIQGKRKGLAGERSGLFFEVCRILREIQPSWVVLENVTGLLSCNDSKDFETVIKSLAQCGYVGYWRVLNAQYFGVPQARRRVFLVAGLGQFPPLDFMADASPVEHVRGKGGEKHEEISADTWAGNTLCTKNTPSKLAINEILIAHEYGRDQMLERERMSAPNGFCLGLDEANLKETWSAGNAIVPQVAEWVASHLIKAI